MIQRNRLRKRISDLEAVLIKEPMKVLSYDDEGHEYHETVDDMINKNHTWGMKVLSGGGDIREVSRILDFMAYQEGIDLSQGEGWLTEEFKKKSQSPDFKERCRKKSAELEEYAQKTTEEKMLEFFGKDEQTNDEAD